MLFSILTKVWSVFVLCLDLNAQAQSQVKKNLMQPIKIHQKEVPTFHFEEKVEIDETAIKIWSIVKRFENLKWIPMVSQVTYSFNPKKNHEFRTVISNNGWSLSEVKTLTNEQEKLLKFEVIQIQDPNHNFIKPFKKAFTQIQVVPKSSKSCQVIWRTEVIYDLQHPDSQNGEYSLDQIKSFFESTSRSGLENLRLKLK